MLGPALMAAAAALAAALPTYADTDPEALRTEIQEMKTSYEARIQALESHLQAAEAQTVVASSAIPPPMAQGETAQAAGNAFNPEISFILQGGHAHPNARPGRRITGFLPTRAN